MNDHPALERIKALPIFASLTAPSADSALKAAEAAIAGGLTQLSILLSTPGAYRVLSDLRRAHGDSVLVGAGSVVTSEMADRARESMNRGVDQIRSRSDAPATVGAGNASSGAGPASGGPTSRGPGAPASASTYTGVSGGTTSTIGGSTRDDVGAIDRDRT